VKERDVGSKDISDDFRKIEAPDEKAGARLKKMRRGRLKR